MLQSNDCKVVVCTDNNCQLCSTSKTVNRQGQAYIVYTCESSGCKLCREDTDVLLDLFCPYNSDEDIAEMTNSLQKYDEEPWRLCDNVYTTELGDCNNNLCTNEEKRSVPTLQRLQQIASDERGKKRKRGSSSLPPASLQDVFTTCRTTEGKEEQKRLRLQSCENTALPTLQTRSLDCSRESDLPCLRPADLDSSALNDSSSLQRGSSNTSAKKDIPTLRATSFASSQMLRAALQGETGEDDDERQGTNLEMIQNLQPVDEKLLTDLERELEVDQLEDLPELNDIDDFISR